MKDYEMKLTPHILRSLLQAVRMTRPDEIGCDECFEKLDRFAELTLAGRDAAEAFPLVADHLAKCGSCREEFEALLEAIEAIEPQPKRRPFWRLRRSR